MAGNPQTAFVLMNALVVGSETLMTRVELTHTFPVSVGDAFAYITDTKNWKEFFPNFVRLHNPAMQNGTHLVMK